MSKVHLIESCEGCIYQWYGHCVNARADIDTWEGFPDWCPFPDLPEKADENPYDNADKDSFIVNSYEAGFAKGWNTCLRVIEGKEDE